jgi:hypothetical protein
MEKKSTFQIPNQAESQVFNTNFSKSDKAKQKNMCVSGYPTYPIFFAPDPKLFFYHFEKSSGNRHVFPKRFFKV